MNKLTLAFILLIFSIPSFAQVFEYENATIEIEELKTTSTLAKDCISLFVNLKDIEVGIRLQEATILAEGQSPDYPYLTNRAGEVLIITGNKDIILTITPKENYYPPLRLVDLPLEKGKDYKISVQMRFPIPKDLKPLKPQPIDKDVKPLPIREPGPVSLKPVIYLYPTAVTELDIQLKVEGKLTFSYPKHKDSWKCTAYPNGDIKIGERTYPYLFWEGKLNPIHPNIQKTGFVVKSENIVSFLEEKLAHIGLNDKEMTDFITFWAPRLEQNAYNYLHFSIGEEYAKNVATLNINIKPDSELHVHLFHSPIGPDFKVPSQELPKFERKGFTLIEWGGGPVQMTNVY